MSDGLRAELTTNDFVAFSRKPQPRRQNTNQLRSGSFTRRNSRTGPMFCCILWREWAEHLPRTLSEGKYFALVDARRYWLTRCIHQTFDAASKAHYECNIFLASSQILSWCLAHTREVQRIQRNYVDELDAGHDLDQDRFEELLRTIACRIQYHQIFSHEGHRWNQPREPLDGNWSGSLKSSTWSPSKI